ncbi:23S rRNA pseudouridine1911/1915/1917 synthase [Hypnocyclicus thermotrophus]|uniref:Pseudouridine synthase n=1 Tax=Hypnocyclicus thermotrophus TaxID=1627895 RepID=A0AA46DYE9_9FUSO|nr:RluA family pseudouridine synthase [Hypnocyclicus thermotrophus]TDT69875.1 23S rRNA pseudouridine1911/1915/1917 synthase [Hypnocyclicus thermotrophus]
MKKYRIEKEYKGYTISEYLRNIQNYSGRSIRNLEIFLNGKRVKPKKKLRAYEVLLVKEKEKSTNIKPLEIKLNIVYEDEEILIIDKDPGIVVHPTLKKVDKTLANGIVYYFKEKYNKIMIPRFYNRLDMDTSGLIIITKTGFAQSFLQEKCEVKKYYLAIVEGIIEKDEFILEKPIGRIGNNLKREILPIENGGQYAKTKVKVLEKNIEKNITLIEVELFTGRTHQIRVHMSSIGHPLIGDKLYSDKERNIRQLLHAYRLEFINPISKEKQIIEIEMKEDMKKYLYN